MSTQNTLNKIKGLFNKAESAKTLGNIEEAELFFEKANELLLKYNLSPADLSEESVVDNTILHTDYKDNLKFFANKAQGHWEINLISVLAKANFVKPLYNNVSSGYGQPNAILIGTQTNIDIVKYLHSVSINIFPTIAISEYNKHIIEFRERYEVTGTDAEEASLNLAILVGEHYEAAKTVYQKIKNVPGMLGEKISIASRKVAQIEEIMKLEAIDLMPKPYTKGVWQIKSLTKCKASVVDRGVFIRSFLAGVSIGLGKKFKEQIEAAEITFAPYQELDANNNLLPVRSIKEIIQVKNQALTAYMKKEFPNTGTLGTGATASSSAAFGQGVKTGQSHSFNRGLNTGGGSTRLLN